MITALAFCIALHAKLDGHTFTYVSDRELNRVNVAGSFNGWNKDANPLQVGADGHTWTVQIPLAPGRYQYKFVLNGNNWITDPNSVKNEDDGNGNVNSLLLISPVDYAHPAVKGDGTITASALKHLTNIPYLNYDRGQLSLSLQTRTNDIAKVMVVVNGKKPIMMVRAGGDEFYERYSTKLNWDRKTDLHYHYLLNDGAGNFTFGPKGLLPEGRPNDYAVSAASFKPFTVPGWVEKSVIYQIFPDRFANGDKSNDPKNVAPWGSKPLYYNFFGGDIAGVEQHLDYLKGLGISSIFFNPIFKGPSNHRYETTDYFQIDPVFGTNAEFMKLTKDLHKLGIKTILDGVFNHTSTAFAPFADVVKNGADSKFVNWYTFNSFPVHIGNPPNYVAWYNFPSMPKLNYSNPETRKYMLTIPEYWEKTVGIDGWRLDAANEVVQDYWQDFRSRVKNTNSQAWILGEVWGDGSSWLQGDQWDSVMNYPFREAVVGFLGKQGNGKPSDLMNRLMTVYGRYAPQVSRNLMNLVGSHDTPRIRTVCGGDLSLARLAAAIQFTWVGTPSVYYGDELGMEGDRDPDNRRCMDWESAKPDNDLLRDYKKLIHLRNSDPVLQSGDPVPLLVDDAKQVVSYARVLGDRADLVAINRSDREQEVDLSVRNNVALPKAAFKHDFYDAFGGNLITPTGSTLHLRIAPRSAAVFVPRSGTYSHSRRRRSELTGSKVAMSKALLSKELHE